MWFVLLLLCTKSITIFEFGLKHAKGYPSLEYSFICFCFFRNLCLFVVKVYNITKIDKDSTICSYFFFFLVQFPWKWKDQFSQEIITLTWGAITHHPYVRILKQYVFEITTVWCKNCLIFFEIIIWIYLLSQKVSWGRKTHEKLYFKLFLDIITEQNTIF